MSAFLLHGQVSINIFSWKDGKQILNLINKIRPDTVEESNITENPLNNVQLALDTAESEFDIPAVLDASDMACDTPNELVNMTYLSYFRDKVRFHTRLLLFFWKLHV